MGNVLCDSVTPQLIVIQNIVITIKINFNLQILSPEDNCVEASDSDKYSEVTSDFH